MQNIYTTASGEKLEIDTLLAKGGEGEIFNLKGKYKGYCLKVYHPKLRNDERQNKLKYMCDNPPGIHVKEKFRICWPSEIVFSEEEFVGFIMPEAFTDSLMPYHLCQVNIPDKLDPEWNKKYNRDSYNGRINRLMLSANICAAVNQIHSDGRYVLVDLKPQNLLITLDGKVSLIDLDSIQISEGDSILFSAPVSTPEYTPAEAKEILKEDKPITKSWDSFSLGIIIYEILCGIHPYTGTSNPPYEDVSTISGKIENNQTHIIIGKSAFKILPPVHNNFDYLSPELKEIFKDIFSAHSDIQERPTVGDLGKVLAKEIIFFKENQEKIKQQEAIDNYDSLEKNYRTLNLQLRSAKENIKRYEEEIKIKNTKISELNNSRNSAWILFAAVIILGLIILLVKTGIYNTNLDKLNNQLRQKDKIEQELAASNRQNEILRDGLNTANEKLNVVKSYAPLMLIKNIQYNSETNDKTIINYGGKLYANKCYYISPKITYYGIKPGTYDIYMKMFDPVGKLDDGLTSPTGYCSVNKNQQIKSGENILYLSGWGNASGNSYKPGYYTYELWINNKLIYRDRFHVYPYY